MTHSANGLQESRNGRERGRLELRVKWLGGGAFDEKGTRAAPPNELGEWIEMLKIRGAQEIAQIRLGQRAVA